MQIARWRLQTRDVANNWTPWLRHGAALAASMSALSLSSCMLLGYENQQATQPDSADGGVIGVVPHQASDEPTQDNSVPEAGLAGAADSGLLSGPLPVADASTTSAVDAGRSTAVAPSIPGCLGTPALGLCWHLGASGVSCDEACDTYYGGFDSRTVSETGKPSEGGSLANCQTVLVALGITAAPTASYRPDGLGLGCHQSASGATYWLDQRQGPFDSGDSLFNVRRACACAH